MTIQTEQTTVYRGGGRRWFSKRAAAKAEARAMLYRRYPCECDDDDPAIGYPGVCCYVHAMDCFHYAKIIRRLARLYLKVD
jgi:hypothetical protein